jgi:hypothetical protein
MQNERTTDLDWLAFQYAMDELSPVEAREFEDRLARDQHAREALAEAVLLVHALERSAVPVVGAANIGRRFASGVIWAACGAAACLAIVFAGQFRPQDEVKQMATPVQPTREEALAQAWFSARLPVPESDTLGGDPASEEEVGLASGEGDSGVSVPLWMLEAVQDVSGAVADSVKES